MINVGILGGGQLGLMLAEPLQQLGATVHIYDPNPKVLSLSKLANVTTAPWDDLQALREFFERCDVVTYESENVPAGPFFEAGVVDKMRPSISVLEIVQDRIREKTFLANAGLPHVAFRSLHNIDELPGVLAKFGYPAILKSATGGYDGKGQYRLNGPEDLADLPPLRDGAAGWWVVEEVVDIALEVSCVVAIGEDGEEQTFPIFENDHRNHILDVTVAPARIPDTVAEEVHKVALVAARRLGVVGLITVEFFLLHTPGRYEGESMVDGWHLRINEFAPRAHNSGHVSRKSCTFSQFDALARILTRTPIGTPTSLPGGFAMGQLLGEVWQAQGRTDALDLAAWSRHPDVLEVFQYGKSGVKAKRKMGHYITRGNDSDAAEAAARAFRDDLMGRSSD